MATFKWRLAQWFELRWWKNYLQGKSKAEYIAWKNTYWQNTLATINDVLQLTPGKTVCDLGCGPAGIFIALPYNKVTAADPLIDAYETQTLFFNKRDYPHTTFVKSTIEDFKTVQKFDVVFCMNAINHVYDIQQGFNKLNEVCTGGGTLVISIDAHNHSFFKHLFRLLPGDVLHPHQYDLEEYKAFIKQQNFEIVKAELLKKEFFFSHYLIVACK